MPLKNNMKIHRELLKAWKRVSNMTVESESKYSSVFSTFTERAIKSKNQVIDQIRSYVWLESTNYPFQNKRSSYNAVLGL